MILESDDHGADSSCDVCILGAGLVGIYLADALRLRGVSVTILERGGSKSFPASEREVEFALDEYEGATSGRYFGLGGTSVAWGGQLAVMTEHELREVLPGQPEAWPISMAELRPHYDSVLRRYGLANDPLASILRDHESDNAILSSPGFALSLNTAYRNAARLWKRTLHSAELNVVLNAQAESVTTYGLSGDLRISQLAFRARNGVLRHVRCKALVVCAGALESTRVYQGVLSSALKDRKSLAAGSMLQDHLSVPIGRLEIRDLEAFREMFSPHFSKHGILFRRTFCSRGAGKTSGFIHAVYAERDGFPNWLHDTMQSIQAGSVSRLAKHAIQAPKFASSAVTLAAGYLSHKRVEWPTRTQFNLLLDLEQLPDERNRIEDGSKLRVAWTITDEDRRNSREFVDEIRNEWENRGLASIAGITPTSENEPRGKVAFHPTGTLRMSSTARNGAVDMDCRCHGFSNVFVVATAVFPRCGAANPSFTLLALADRATTAVMEATK